MLFALLAIVCSALTELAEGAEGRSSKTPHNAFAFSEVARRELAAELHQIGEIRAIAGLQTPLDIAHAVATMPDQTHDQKIAARRLDTLQHFAGQSSVIPASQHRGPPKKPDLPSSAYPTWRTNMKVNQIAPIAGTAPTAYNLEPAWNTSGNKLAWVAGTFDAYNGLQFDTKRGTVYNSLSGGHRSVEQNGVYKIDLMVNNPRWSVVRDSTAHRPHDPANQSVPYFPSDGRPTSRHTYYNGVVVDIDGSPVIIHTDNSAPTYTGFGPSGIVDAFRIARGDWDPAGTWQKNPGALGPGQCVAKDPRDQTIWTADRANKIWRLDTKTKTWSFVAPGLNGVFAQSCLVDVIRDRIVAGNSFVNLNRALSVYNISAGTNEEKILIDAGGLSYFKPGQSWAALTHDTMNDRYLWVGNTGKILAIDPKTFQVSIVSDAPTPQVLPHVFGRFEFLPGLGGAVYHPGWTSPLMFLPVK